MVRAFRLEGAMRDRFFRRVNDLVASSTRTAFLGALVERSAGIGILFLQVAVLGVGALMAFEGLLTIGTLVSFQALFMTVSWSLSYVTQYVPNLVVAAGGLQRIDDYLAAAPPVADRPWRRTRCRAARATSVSRVSSSGFPACRRSSGASISRCAPASASPSSGRSDRVRAPCCACSRGLPIPTAAASCSTVTTFAADAGIAAPADRRRLPGRPAARRHDSREHPARQTRGDGLGGGGRVGAGRPARHRRATAARLRHGGRHARRAVVRRPAATGGDCPRHAARSRRSCCSTNRPRRSTPTRIASCAWRLNTCRAARP